MSWISKVFNRQLDEFNNQRKTCGRCGNTVAGEPEWDDHQRFHLYGGGFFKAFVMKSDSGYYFGANSGFGFQGAKYVDPAVFDDRTLQREMKALMDLEGTESGGYATIPEEITEYPLLAKALREFIGRYFPEQAA